MKEKCVCNGFNEECAFCQGTGYINIDKNEPIPLDGATINVSKEMLALKGLNVNRKCPFCSYRPVSPTILYFHISQKHKEKLNEIQLISPGDATLGRIVFQRKYNDGFLVFFSLEKSIQEGVIYLEKDDFYRIFDRGTPKVAFKLKIKSMIDSFLYELELIKNA